MNKVVVSINEMGEWKQLRQLLWRSSGFKVLVIALLIIGGAHHFLIGWSLVDIIIVILFVFLKSIPEWFIHTYIMHANPLPLLGFRLKNPIYYMHLHHHKYPEDIEGLFFKGRSIFALLVITYLVFLPVSLHVTNIFVFCFALGLLFYEVFHMFSHSAIEIPNKKLMSVVMNHRCHHQLSSRYYFGVSSILADRLFKTLQEKNSSMSR